MRQFVMKTWVGIMMLVIVCLGLTSCAVISVTDRGISVRQLNCEYAQNPLGIDTHSPRFSWFLESSQRGQLQSAYRILVAGSKEKLDAGVGDKWDTGKIVSETSVNVPYQGKALSSGEKCFWKVRVWDKEGHASLWSAPATFEMGLLNEKDWQGQWIGRSLTEKKTSKYIAGRFGQAIRLNGTSGSVKIEHYAQLKPAKEITVSTWIKPDDNFNERWQEIYRKEDGNARCLLAYGKTGDKTGLWFGLGIGGQYTEFCGLLALETVKDRRWHLATVTYDGSNMRIYFDGREIDRLAVSGPIDTSGTRAAFIGSNGGQNEFFSGAIDDVRIYDRSLSATDIQTLAEGKHVASEPVGHWKLDGNLKNSISGKDGVLTEAAETHNAPLLRKEFSISKKITKARVYITGVGWYELYINGKKVGDHLLDPATTDYKKRILYTTYDITGILNRGVNALGVMLGNGWFSEPGTLKYGDSPRLLLQMNIELADGTRKHIVSDSAWKTADGPITYNDLWHGETYDARQEKEGWTKVGYDDSNWAAAEAKSNPGGKMVSQIMPAIKVNQTIRPVKLTHPKPGIHVYDLGQLFGGWARLKMKGSRGSEVKIKYSDRLTESGLVEDRWMTRRPHGNETDYYILKGDPQGEIYEPRFTYHPVRYVQITGYPGELTLADLEGKVIYSAVDMSGNFECSNPLLNQIHRNVVWTLTNGLFGVPLDCLHREHWAWTDPATVTGSLYPRKYMPLFWIKWLNDIKDAQRADGAVPDICPAYFRDIADPAWGGNYPIMLWYLYQYYEDKRFLEEHYEGMKSWLGYLATISDDYIVTKGHYGDHMLPGMKPGQEQFISRETPSRLVWTGYYYRDAYVVSQIAKILGKPDEAKQYAALAKAIREAFNRKWLKSDRNIYETGSQTAGFLPLALDIIPETNRKQVLQNLVKDIAEKYQFHHHTGNTGTTCMIDALAEHGYGDVMYKIAAQTTYPGWGYMVAQGATTIWEDWGQGRGAESMVMWLTIDEFFYNDLAGIKGPDYYGPGFMTPGFRQIDIKPYVPSDLSWASGSIKTVRGMVTSSWKKTDDSITLTVSIPVNSESKVSVPKIGLRNVTITESGTVVWQNGKYLPGISGITQGNETDDYVTFETGSGSYTFVLQGQR